MLKIFNKNHYISEIYTVTFVYTVQKTIKLKDKTHFKLN